MRKLFWLVMVCGTLPLVSAACSSDKPTNDGGGDSTSTGGKASNNGGKGSGDTDTGAVAAGGDEPGVPEGGEPATGEGGGAGQSSASPCDLSGKGKKVADIITPIDFDITLTSDTVWRLSDYVFVQSGATLTIEPCTRIVGDGSKVSALFVTRDSKIMAEGTENEPILFTSERPVGQRKAGDWAGVVLLGNAPTNLADPLIEGVPDRQVFHYGGDDPEDSSGVMKYVRIEFAGYALFTDKELNGLTFGGVGRGTTISHIEVSNGLDDCFEWFGGTVDVDHLVCNSDGDDTFDTDLGYTGNMSYLFGRKRANPSMDPNGFESDNQKGGENSEPRTNPTVKNVTLCGFGFDVGAPTYSATIRRGAWGNYDHWVETGFDFGIDVRDIGPDAGLFVTNSTMFANLKGDIIAPGDCSVHGQPQNPSDPNSPVIACGVSGGTSDDGFDEEAWFDGTSPDYPDNTGNSTDSPGFTVEDCQADGGPNKKVTGSKQGAFVDGNWLKGAWLDWADK